MKNFLLTVKNKKGAIAIKKKIASTSLKAALNASIELYGDIYQEITVINLDKK